MKVLITGGAGYLGSIITQELLNDGHKVTVIDNLMYNQISMLHLFNNENYKFIYGDVNNHIGLLPLIKEAEVIIPLAAIVGAPACDKNPTLANNVNFKQVEFIVNNANKEQYIILPNTNSQYGSSKEIITENSPINPLSLYARLKCDAEKCLLDSGNGISLRLATVFGLSPRMRMDLLVNDFVYKAVHDGYLVLFESHFKRNYIHITDVAKTFKFMINNYENRNGQIYNVGLSNANLSKFELATKIKKYVPNLVIKEDDFKQDFDMRNYIVSNEKLESTGWKPNITLDDGILQLVRAYPILSNKLNKNFTNL